MEKTKRSKQQDDKEQHSELPNCTEHLQDVRIEFQDSARSSAIRNFAEKKFYNADPSNQQHQRNKGRTEKSR